MHSIENDLVHEDIVALNAHLYLTSDTGRRRLRVYRQTLCLVTAVLGGLMVGGVSRDVIDGVIAAVVLGVLCWVFAPQFWWREVRKGLARGTPDERLGATGRHRLTVEDWGIRQETERGGADVPWDRIAHIGAMPEHVFVFHGPAQALIIPTRTHGAAQFVQEVRERLADAQDVRGSEPLARA